MSKNYKNSIDKIVMSDELKDKIISNASKKKTKKNYYKYSSFAACFVMALFSVFIAKYINISNNRTPDTSFSKSDFSETTTIYDYEENVENTEAITEATTYYLVETTTKKTNNIKTVKDKEENKPKTEPKTESKTEVLTENINKEKDTDKNTDNNTNSVITSGNISEKGLKITTEGITQQTTAYSDIAKSSDYGIKADESADMGSEEVFEDRVTVNNISADTKNQEAFEDKITVKKPASIRKFYFTSKFRNGYFGYSSGGGGGGGSYAPKKINGINDLPKDNIIVEPVYPTKTQYYEMIEDIKKLVGFDFNSLPYDENAEICAALNGNTVVIRYIYDDDYITFCAEKGALNCSHDYSLYYKTETKEGITLKSDGTNYYLAVCAKLPVSYSICSYKGITKERILELCNKLN